MIWIILGILALFLIIILLGFPPVPDEYKKRWKR